jgi:hypothetical protein
MPDDDYLAYLARFEHQVGALAVGGYGKWKGRLVRKLAADEWKTKHGEYAKLNDAYLKILERGDTMNDAITKLLRERRSELLIDEPENQP